MIDSSGIIALLLHVIFRLEVWFYGSLALGVERNVTPHTLLPQMKMRWESKDKMILHLLGIIIGDKPCQK